MTKLIKYKQSVVSLQNTIIKAYGPIGTISKIFNGKGILFIENKLFFFSRENYKIFKSLFGNMHIGVVYGFFIELNFIGLGNRFLKVRNFLLLKLGFSHYVKYIIPSGVKIIGYKRKLIIYGMSLFQINQIAKQLRLFKKPSIYKGKGIQILGERIKYKIGKQR